MPKRTNPIVCCLGCGRDTTQRTGYCLRCYRNTGMAVSRKRERIQEQKERRPEIFGESRKSSSASRYHGYEID